MTTTNDFPAEFAAAQFDNSDGGIIWNEPSGWYNFEDMLDEEFGTVKDEPRQDQHAP